MIRHGFQGSSIRYEVHLQQALAITKPPALRAQFLLEGGFNYYHRTVRHGGAFELGVMLPYAYRTAREGHELTRGTGRRS